MNCFAAESVSALLESPRVALNAACHLPLLETEVPFIVGFVCVAIVALFAFAFIWMVVASVRFSIGFRRLSSRIRAIRQRNEPMDQGKLERVGDVLKMNKNTRHGWFEFSETLVASERGILNTRPVQEFFPEQDIVEARIHLGFFESVPALLTGLGLFATFVALFLGLGELDVSGDGKIDGIQPFVTALSGKFLSSVLGLLTAVVFTFSRAFCVPGAHRAYRRFCEAFDALFDRVTPEDLLRRIHDQSSEQSATLKSLATDISSRFTEGMNENLKPPLERMIDLLQRSVEERAETFEQMASQLADTFRSNLTQSTNLEFDQITNALNQTIGVVTRMEERSAESQRSFGGLVGSIESLQASMGQMLDNLQAAAGGLQQGGLEAQEKMIAAAEALSRQISSGASEATDSLAMTARSVIQQNSEEASKIQERLERLFEREEGRSEILQQQREAQREAVRELGIVLGESKGTLEGLTVAAHRARDAAAGLQGAADQLTQAQGAGRSLVEASATQAEAMKRVLSANEELLGEYERVFRQVDDGLSGAVKKIAETLVQFQEDATDQLKRQLGTFDEHLGAATDKLGSAVQDLGERLEDAAEIIENAVERVGPSRG